MKVLLRITFAICLLVATVCGCSPHQGRSRSAAMPADEEKKMAQAMAEGRATLDQFLARLDSPQTGDSDFSLRVRIKDHNGIEYLWVSGVKVEEDGFSGVIESEPDIVQSVALDQRYSFPRSDITDWMYMSGGVMQGNFTLRAKLEFTAPEEVEVLKKTVGW